jgi:hypothetical protein
MSGQPKGDCYRTALNTAQALVGCCLSPLGEVKSVAVIHGSVFHSSGRRIDHAWVEIGDDEVVDGCCGIASEIAKEDYVKKTQAVEEARYSVEQALEHGVKSGHWGPWHKP